MTRCVISFVVFGAATWFAPVAQADHHVTGSAAAARAAVWHDAAYRPEQAADIQPVGHGGRYHRPHHNHGHRHHGHHHVQPYRHYYGGSHYGVRPHGYYVPGHYYHPPYPHVDLHVPYGGYYPGHYYGGGGIGISGPRASLWIGF